jgi:hypothetical protein
LSVARATIEVVEVLATDVARIPAGNLRVPRSEFAALWAGAEHFLEQHPGDWYAFGVVATCRWIATATVRPRTGSWYVAPAPITQRSASAYEELIEAEYLAAETLSLRQPPPAWLSKQPGWLDGVLAMFAWAWRRSARPPLDLGGTTAATG